jgi:Outer membrane protein beta-barrel domain
MLNRTLLTIALLSAVCTIPTQAQSRNEEGEFNFSIGGGLSVPLNPTANYVDYSGSFVAGGGRNFGQHNAIVGQFMWAGLPPPSFLPPALSTIAEQNGLSSRGNLYNISVDYKYRSGFGKIFGVYLLAGGGWYYRRVSLSEGISIPNDTVCQPIWLWYGFTCSNGFVNTIRANAGTGSFGVNAGIGFTLRIKDTPWKFFMESRYNYAPTRNINTQVVPVTFGFAYQ